MLIRRCIRLFSTRQEELAKLKASLPKDRFYALEDKEFIDPSDKAKDTLKGRFDDMKKQFGEDYKTPDEKYDLHLPRTDNPDGGKSMYDRFHEENQYKHSTYLLRGLGLILVYITFKQYRNHFRDLQNEKVITEKFNLLETAKRERNKKLEAVLERRRNEIKTLKSAELGNK